MSTYKLTPLEELRLEKKRLREERAIASRRLSYQLQYLNNNWAQLHTKQQERETLSGVQPAHSEERILPRTLHIVL